MVRAYTPIIIAQSESRQVVSSRPHINRNSTIRIATCGNMSVVRAHDPSTSSTCLLDLFSPRQHSQAMAEVCKICLRVMHGGEEHRTSNRALVAALPLMVERHSRSHCGSAALSLGGTAAVVCSAALPLGRLAARPPYTLQSAGAPDPVGLSPLVS